MNVGVGLPNTIPGAGGDLIAEWARHADDGPFTSLGVLDRLAYDSLDPFGVLSAAAAVTQRARLVTMIAIGPLRSAAMLAKQAATVDRLSDGRLVLGLAVGARRDDYEAAGAEHRTRGRVLSEQLVHLRENGLREDMEILIGGGSGAAMQRMARHADGYVHGGGPPRAFARAAATAQAAWSDLGRPGRPKLWGQAYFALGDEAAGDAYLRDYYAFTGPFAERIAAGNLTSGRAIKDFVRGYAEAGCDELVLLPTVPDIEQLHRLREVVAA